MKSFAEQFKNYHYQHLQHLNRIAHYISVPALLLSFLIISSWVSIVIGNRWHISFAWLEIIVLSIYYFFVDIKLATLTTVVLLLFVLLATSIGYPAPSRFNLSIFLILFIGGGLLQFVGHSLEPKRRVIGANSQFLLLAPMFILAEILNSLKLGNYFSLEPHVHDIHPELKINKKPPRDHQNF